MQLKTILNRCQKFKSFVYRNVRLVESGSGPGEIEVEIVPRKNAKPVCSGCQRPGSVYDHQGMRRFEFIPIWGFAVFFVYQMRRVNCRRCGVKVEQVPWGRGKRELTITYMQYLAQWAEKLSWKEVADHFRTSWEKVFSAVEYVVDWGLKHRDLSGIEAIGVDEIARRRGHDYVTLVYQIDQGHTRLLWVGKERTSKTLEGFFDLLGPERSQQLKYVCSDMWQAYLKVIKERASQALHVLDRFHIMSMFNKAIDSVRAEEHRQLKKDGYEPVLTKSRWSLLKRRENLTENQEAKLSELLKYNLRSIRAYLLREDFNGLWEYVSPTWAGKFLDRWTTRAMRSKIEPMKKVARNIRQHRELILNWFKAKKTISNGVVEGLNNKAKVTARKSYGFRTYRCLEIALYHALGRLPVPEAAHRFY
ncbi:ISL3 family transposase [Microbulbifer rhizosphaerae]|uniref:Transposase n=1 Tax=Microbulbifer rhizosphaerae TaxID=1562603 RepID=A0A7W4WGB5_9GAMM|nr:ISL3 family transposase [Microbulbifer rhizosphaerae]MBB3063725.1 transposase [Microbulbifer rhizosphaerae]